MDGRRGRPETPTGDVADGDGIAVDMQDAGDPAAIEGQPPAPQELVSEEAIDADELDASVDESYDEAIAPADELTALGQLLTAAGFAWEFLDSSSEGVVRLRFDLPAGRSSRTVVVDAVDAARILTGGIDRWRSLERYDGIWNGKEGIIEVAIRPERMPNPYVLRRIVDAAGGPASADEADVLAAELIDDDSGITIRIGEASEFSAVLLAGRRLYRSRPPMTLRVWPILATTTDEADSLIERVTDSVSVDLGLSIGASVIAQRLESRSAVRRGAPRRRRQVTFPRNRYPHAPVTLYQAGRDHRTSPLIRYWSFYQVLEYFFPTHSQAEAVRQLSRHLRSPQFDAYDEEDVLRAVQIAGAAGRGHASEEVQLRTTLTAIVTAEELAMFVEESGLADQLADRKSQLSSNTVNAKSGGDLLPQLSQRIYDVRCRIVHSKSGRTPGEGAGLLPGTHHDDLVRDELALLEFLAQQALVAAADRISLPRQ